MATPVLPPLEGTTLSGRVMRLPEDLPEGGLLLLFGLTHAARHDVGAWKAALTKRGMPFLSLPTAMEDLPAELLASVAAAMRVQVPPPGWDGVLQIHRGGPALRAAFGWEPDAFAKVLRTGPGGRVLGRHDGGPFSEAALDRILRAVLS